MSFAAAYRDARLRLTELAGAVGDGGLDTVVPASPDWQVRDVLAHLAGLVADVNAGRIDGVGTDDWTAGHVTDRKGRAIDDVLDEWRREAEPIEAQLDGWPKGGAASLVGDIAVHEADVRAALGRPPVADGPTFDVAFDAYVRGLGRRLKERGLPALRVLDAVAGDGEPAASVTGERFEVFRAMTGRRTQDEVRALTWDGEAAPYVEVFSAYGWPASPLDE